MIVLSMIMLEVFAAGRELIDEARDATQAGQDVVARSGDWGAFSVKVTAIWRFRRGGVPTGSADHPGARAKAIIGRVVATCGVVVLMPMLLTMMVKSIKDRVDCDIRYVDNWSIISDIPINLRTIVELVRGRNAY